jgi:hypothetical protein
MLLDASGDANYALTDTPQNDRCSEVQTLYQQPRSRPGVVQSDRKKVRCTWPGYSRLVRMDGRTRHVNETHLRVATGKAFQRTYLETKHESTCRDD